MTSALLAAIWQGLLLAAIVALCLRLVPALTAAARSLVWLTVAALAVLLHFAQSPGGPVSPLTPASPRQHSIQLSPSTLAGALSSPPSGLPPRSSARSNSSPAPLELRRLARTATLVAAPEGCDLLLARSRRPESHTAQLCTSTEVDRPSVLGFFRPAHPAAGDPYSAS